MNKKKALLVLLLLVMAVGMQSDTALALDAEALLLDIEDAIETFLVFIAYVALIGVTGALGYIYFDRILDLVTLRQQQSAELHRHSEVANKETSAES